MAEYLAMRIRDGAMAYDAVIRRFPQYQEQIDEIIGNEVMV